MTTTTYDFTGDLVHILENKVIHIAYLKRMEVLLAREKMLILMIFTAESAAIVKLTLASDGRGSATRHVAIGASPFLLVSDPHNPNLSNVQRPDVEQFLSSFKSSWAHTSLPVAEL